MEKFLVLGSNSFSGASFVARLMEEDREVVGISRSPEPNEVFLPYKWARHNQFSFYQFDINNDLDKIMSVINSFQPEYIVNFAAQSMVSQSWASPSEWFMTNTVSMVKLHDRLKHSGFLKKFVQASTPEVYGQIKGVVKENTCYNPSTPYAVSKAACDMSLMTFFKTYGFPVVFTRSANVCGAGQQLYRIIPRTILCVLLGKKLKLEGGGRAVRSFINIRDVAEGTLKVAREAPAGNIYHLSTDTQVSVRELTKRICSQMGAVWENHIEIVKPRLGEDSAYLLDAMGAKDELCWQPKVSLNETIAETVKWIKNNLSIIRKQPMEYIHKP